MGSIHPTMSGNIHRRGRHPRPPSAKSSSDAGGGRLSLNNNVVTGSLLSKNHEQPGLRQRVMSMAIMTPGKIRRFILALVVVSLSVVAYWCSPKIGMAMMSARTVFPTAGAVGRQEQDIDERVKRTLQEYGIPLPDKNDDMDEVVNQKATLVLMSHSMNRVDNINMLLWCYQRMDHVIDKIIFVWNNLDNDPPEMVNYGEGGLSNNIKYVPIELFQPKENLMTNRFDAARKLQLEPDAPMLLVDDDVYLNSGLIRLILKSWEKCEGKCLVGTDPRYADPLKKVYVWEAKPSPKLNHNLVIGKTIMAKNHLFNAYFDHPELVSYASPPSSGCDDISFSLFATNATGVLPTFVPGDHRGETFTDVPLEFFVSERNRTVAGLRYDLLQPDALSLEQRDQSHQLPWAEKRTNCVKFSMDYIGRPLVRTLIKPKIKKLSIILIGNDYKQQFPLIGYGGIEAWVETIAEELHRQGINFSVITPRVTKGRKEYNFPVIETPQKAGTPSVTFISDAKEIILRLEEKPDIIWSCSNWSGEHLHELGIPMIVTHQDSGGGGHLEISTDTSNVVHRFISQKQLELWSETKPWLKDGLENNPSISLQPLQTSYHPEAFWLWVGFGPEEFKLHKDKKPKTCLFVGKVDDGKGVQEFIELARLNPDWTFPMYGTGGSIRDYEPPSNVIFKGELERGMQHYEAFGKASRFFMYVKWQEAFGRVVIEAMSKGTPVLASYEGSLPEIIRGTDGFGEGVAGTLSNNMQQLNASLHQEYDYEKVYEHAKKYFTSEREVEAMLLESLELIEKV